MADIQRMLELNTQLEKGTSQTHQKQGRVANQKDLDRLIETFDNAVYGPSVEPVLKQEQTQVYTAEAEMAHLKDIEKSGGRKAANLEGRNIPRGIVESILNNPLDLPVIDPRMERLEEKLKDNMPGIKAAANILERVEKQEQEAKSKILEQLTPKQQPTAFVDYEHIKVLIENAIDKKLDELKNTLNESVSRSSNYIPSMKYMNFKDKWLFVDNEDNVFECEMKYKGKRKKKN